MRDKKRIPEILNELGKLWMKYPDYRLCQLISNMFPTETDIFYKEDSDLLERLKKKND